jgi:hypothetical protein
MLLFNYGVTPTIKHTFFYTSNKEVINGTAAICLSFADFLCFWIPISMYEKRANVAAFSKRRFYLVSHLILEKFILFMLIILSLSIMSLASFIVNFAIYLYSSTDFLIIS